MGFENCKNATQFSFMQHKNISLAPITTPMIDFGLNTLATSCVEQTIRISVVMRPLRPWKFVFSGVSPWKICITIKAWARFSWSLVKPAWYLSDHSEKTFIVTGLEKVFELLLATLNPISPQQGYLHILPWYKAINVKSLWSLRDKAAQTQNQ